MTPTIPRTNYEGLDREVQHCLDRGDRDLAAGLTIRRLEGEIFGFLTTLHRTEQEAAEVFALFADRLWRGFGAYHGDCSVRTWAYLIARRTSTNYRRDEHRRQRRFRQFADSGEPDQTVAELRSDTASYLRSDRRAIFTELRRSLSVEDQTLLILRVDRGLSWIDLARVFDDASKEEMPSNGGVATRARVRYPNDPDSPEAAQALAREAGRLRKRFQLVKERLLVMGRQAGVVAARET